MFSLSKHQRQETEWQCKIQCSNDYHLFCLLQINIVKFRPIQFAALCDDLNGTFYLELYRFIASELISRRSPMCRACGSTMLFEEKLNSVSCQNQHHRRTVRPSTLNVDKATFECCWMILAGKKWLRIVSFIPNSTYNMHRMTDFSTTRIHWDRKIYFQLSRIVGWVQAWLPCQMICTPLIMAYVRTCCLDVGLIAASWRLQFMISFQ